MAQVVAVARVAAAAEEEGVETAAEETAVAEVEAAVGSVEEVAAVAVAVAVVAVEDSAEVAAVEGSAEAEAGTRTRVHLELRSTPTTPARMSTTLRQAGTRRTGMVRCEGLGVGS